LVVPQAIPGAGSRKMPPRLPFTCLRRVSVTASDVPQLKNHALSSAYTRHRCGRSERPATCTKSTGTARRRPGSSRPRRAARSHGRGLDLLDGASAVTFIATQLVTDDLDPVPADCGVVLLRRARVPGRLLDAIADEVMAAGRP
jgi:hypothetical protein